MGDKRFSFIVDDVRDNSEKKFSHYIYANYCYIIVCDYYCCLNYSMYTQCKITLAISFCSNSI